ncbi:MAG: hypothetical protein QXH03_02905 [Candidatus Bathyarchaeia archaeon]
MAEYVHLPPDWNRHLIEALKLMRDFRAKAVAMNIDARAVRVALKFALLVDDKCAKEAGLTEEQDKLLDGLAMEIFKRVRDS